MSQVVNEVDKYIEHLNSSHIPFKERIAEAFDEFMVNRAMNNPEALKKLAHSFVTKKFKDREAARHNSVFYHVVYNLAQKRLKETASLLLAIGQTEKELNKPVEVMRYFLNYIATHMEPVPYEIMNEHVRKGKQAWYRYVEENKEKNDKLLKALLQEIKSQNASFFDSELATAYQVYL